MWLLYMRNISTIKIVWIEKYYFLNFNIMLQFPDFDEKQIIFIESFDIKNINFENENLVIKENWKIKNKVSLYKIFTIFLIWETTITSVFIRKIQEYCITIVFLKKNFLPYLVIWNQTEWNFVLRKKQYEKTEEEMLEIAKKIVLLKTKNQLSLLKNIRVKEDCTKQDIKWINEIILKIPNSENYDNLLWYEWNVSKLFFRNYFWSIGWIRREPRTKFDIKNLLLDVWYTYLFHFIEALLRLYWFDNYYWVYHRTWYQRKSLALDIMEPFRCIIDRALLKSYNLKQINEKDFDFYNWRYVLPWQNAKKYSSFFLKEIMNNKEEMFFFVKDYYKYFIKGKSEFPKFEI